MKKTFWGLAAPALGCLLLTSCLREKEYSCECTYVASATGPNAGQPDRVERTLLKGRLKSDVAVDCDQLEPKYTVQFYQGSCVLR